MKTLIYFICFVCVYDIYLTVKQSDTIYKDETNPVAKLLITEEKIIHKYTYNGVTLEDVVENKYDISNLVLFKMLGLIAAIHIFVWTLKYRVHKLVIPTVAFFQLLLLIHLLL